MKPLECIHTLPNVPIVCQERHGVQQFLKTNVFPSSFVFLSSQQTDQNCTECKAGRWLTTRRMCSQHKSESFPLFAKRLKNMILILFSPPPHSPRDQTCNLVCAKQGLKPWARSSGTPFFFLQLTSNLILWMLKNNFWKPFLGLKLRSSGFCGKCAL